MTINDLLTILPRYADDSGYEVTVNYKRKCGTRQKNSLNYNHIHLPDDPANKFDDMNVGINELRQILKLEYEQFLDLEVETISQCRRLVGGDTDYNLQIWLITEEFCV